MVRTRMKRHIPGVAVGFAAALLAFAPTARAQESDSELRRHNAQLQNQVEDLQNELEAARDQIKRLEEEVAELRRKLDALPAAAPSLPPRLPPPAQPPLEPEEVTIDESVPNASPRALLSALVESYQNFAAALDVGVAGDPTRRAYLRKLEGWRSAATREFRGPIAWHVRVRDSFAAPNGGLFLTLIAIDPHTHARLGNPFEVTLSRAAADRLARLEQRFEIDVLVLKGTLVPTVRINDARETRGSFDNPPFIGPFAEFDFTVEVTSLLPAPEEPTPTPAPAPGSSAPGSSAPAPGSSAPGAAATPPPPPPPMVVVPPAKP